MEAALQLQKTAGEPWEAKLSFWRSLGDRKEAALRQQNLRFPLYFTGVRANDGKSKTQQKKQENVEKVLCFTVLDAIS